MEKNHIHTSKSLTFLITSLMKINAIRQSYAIVLVHSLTWIVTSYFFLFHQNSTPFQVLTLRWPFFSSLRKLKSWEEGFYTPPLPHVHTYLLLCQFTLPDLLSRLLARTNPVTCYTHLLSTPHRYCCNVSIFWILFGSHHTTLISIKVCCYSPILKNILFTLLLPLAYGPFLFLLL